VQQTWLCRGAGTATPSSPVEGRILRYWNRLCSEKIPDLLREAFDREAFDLATWMHQSGKTTWVSKVKELFDKAGMSFAFTNQGCGQEIIEKVM